MLDAPRPARSRSHRLALTAAAMVQPQRDGQRLDRSPSPLGGTMPTARVTSAGEAVELYYEETGHGFPLIWCHEYGGDYRSWEPQVRYFSRRYRVITWNYRGYPPSEVPPDPAAYRNETLVEDLAALLRHLGIERAHVGGLSM